jgi:hypothetical protein
MRIKQYRKPHTFTPADDKKLKKMFDAGMSYIEMTEKSDFTTTQIMNRGYTCGWKYLHKHDFTKQAIEKAEYRATGELVHKNGKPVEFESVELAPTLKGYPRVCV